MSPATAAAETLAPTSIGVLDVARAVWHWLQKNVRAAIISAAIGYVIGYIGNVWFMAIFYDGAQKVPPGGPASGEGNVAMGSLFWGLITTVLFGVFGYYRAVGGARFREDLRQLPGALVSLFTRDGGAGRVHLLWGAAASLLATQLISPAVGAVLAVGLLASLPGVLGRVLASFLMRVWAQLLQKVAPTRGHRAAGIVAVSVGILGASAAMLIGFFLPGDVGGAPTRLLIAIACGLLAVLISRGGAPGTAVPLLLLAFGGGTLFAGVVHPLLAHANDGGVAECGVSWTQWLTQCPGKANVLLHAIAGAIAASIGAPVGLVLGLLSGGGGGFDLSELFGSGPGGPGSDGGTGSGGGDLPADSPPPGGDAAPPSSGPIAPPPPVPAFPHVFMRGGSIVIECANGVILTAPVNPDGSVGQWSATNLHTQSDGAVANRLTGEDGSVTTYYTDGSVVTRDPSGGITTWGTDGTVSITNTDGTVQTTHPDGSVDVRSADGTVDTTMRDGTRVHTEPDGTTVTTNPDGSTVTHWPDGSADATRADGTQIHQSADGSVTITQPDGTQTLQWTDGTTVTTRPDGSTSTAWPDGSSQQVNADGTTITTSPDGTRTVLQPDGTFTTLHTDGSTVIAKPDGTQIVESRDGSVTTTLPNGTSSTTYPGGWTLTHNADGTLSATAPDGTPLGDPMARLRTIGDSLGLAQEYPNAAGAATGLYGQWQALMDKVQAQGGQWTPADLAAMTWLQNAQNQLSDAISKNIAVDQQAFANQQMAQLLARENADPSTLHDMGNGQMTSINQQLQAIIDKQEGYIRSHIADLPPGQWAQVESILSQIDSSSPNPAAIDRLSRLSHAMFGEMQTGSSDGRAISALVNLPGPPPPQEPPLTGAALVADLISKQQSFITDHMDQLSLAESQRLNALVNRTLGSSSPADLAELQKYTHAMFNQLQGSSESAGAAATMDAIKAEEQRVMWERAGKAAAGAELVIMAPLMVAGGVGMVSSTAGAWVAGALAPVTMPGAAAAAGQLGLMYLGANAIKGGAGGYYGGTDPDPTKRILYGVAEATLPVNTINAYNALRSGQDVSNSQIALSVLQDLGNVAQLHGAGTQLTEVVGGPGGLIDRLTMKPSDAALAMDAGAIADRAAGQAKVAEFKDSMLQAHNDDAWVAARDRLDRLQAGLAADPHNSALPGRIRDAQAALDAIPAQQRLNQAATDLLGDYQGKNILKQTPMEIQGQYNQQLAPIMDKVDQQFIDAMNAAGMQRGGRPFMASDLVDLRNASSVTAGMDRDLALNEMYARDLQAQLAKLPPGSQQAADLQSELNRVQQMSKLTVTSVDANGNLVTKQISPSDWQKQAQTLYNKAFNGVTGQDAQGALQQITQSKNIEAYPDLNVLKNNPVDYPFDAGHADAIGDVTSVKAANAEHDLNASNAMQETARGTAKDISTKLEPLLASQGADQATLAKLQEMQDFLKTYGNGNMLPSQADLYARMHFGTDVRGLCDRVAASMTTAIKFQPQMMGPPSMSTGTALSGAQGITDATTLYHGAEPPGPPQGS
jgi:hypothetical protein